MDRQTLIGYAADEVWQLVTECRTAEAFGLPLVAAAGWKEAERLAGAVSTASDKGGRLPLPLAELLARDFELTGTEDRIEMYQRRAC